MPEVETAALGPIAEMTTASVVRPAAIIQLREPAASIALLPLPMSQMDPDEEADAQDALIDWALSPPGSTTGMNAPSFTARTFSGGSRKSETVQQPVAEVFDKGRFWSDG